MTLNFLSRSPLMCSTLLRSTLLLISLCIYTVTSVQAENAGKPPSVILHTSAGDITIELYPEDAPVTVANFLQYANSGFYDGTIFHRVIKRFMIQAGGFTEGLKPKETLDPIVNESGNGLHNDRYTVAMARKSDPDSATSQFFINTRINATLDAQKGQPGYTVFGMVTEGQHVVKTIEKSKTQTVGRFQDVPVKPVIIESVEVLAAKP